MGFGVSLLDKTIKARKAKLELKHFGCLKSILISQDLTKVAQWLPFCLCARELFYDHGGQTCGANGFTIFAILKH